MVSQIRELCLPRPKVAIPAGKLADLSRPVARDGPEGQGTPVDGHRPLGPLLHVSRLSPSLRPHPGHLVYRAHIVHEPGNILS